MASPNWLNARVGAPQPQSIVVAPQTPQLTTKITALEALSQSLLATGTGFALGVAHSELRNGLDVHGKPADLIGSVLFGALGFFFDNRYCMTISHCCESVYGFRSAVSLLKVLEMSPRKNAPEITVQEKVVDADVESDPVVTAGKDIDDVPTMTVHGETVAAAE